MTGRFALTTPQPVLSSQPAPARRQLRLSWPAGLAAAAFALSVTQAAQAFELKSPDISANAPIGEKFVYNSFGCSGQNISPALEWSDPPSGTKSFALLVHDPDAPTGGAGFWHWLVVDIPADSKGLSQGAGSADGKLLPAGARALESDFGDTAWGGPCPPKGHGAHRYVFTVYALSKEKLDLPPNARTAIVGFTIGQNALGKASLTATYGR